MDEYFSLPSSWLSIFEGFSCHECVAVVSSWFAYLHEKFCFLAVRTPTPLSGPLPALHLLGQYGKLQRAVVLFRFSWLHAQVFPISWYGMPAVIVKRSAHVASSFLGSGTLTIGAVRRDFGAQALWFAGFRKGLVTLQQVFLL